jgi:hypothetical protein
MVLLGLGEEEVKKKERTQGKEKGERGKGDKRDLVFIVPYMLLRNYVLCISMVY